MENDVATVTFDTLELTESLKKAGIPADQAEAVVRAIAKAQDQLVTKTDLDTALSPLRTDLAVLKWMMGVLLAGVICLVLKAFYLTRAANDPTYPRGLLSGIHHG